MTEIEYELREQDLIAFNEFQLKKSDAIQKRMRRHQILLPGFLAIIAMVVWLYFQDTLAFMYIGLLALFWAVATPLYFRWSTRRQIRKLYSEEEKLNLFGVNRLRIEPRQLVEINRNGESGIGWDEVLRIETNRHYAFLFIGIDSALIIPRATVKTGDLHEFVKEADQKIEQAG
ncbi:MAG: hypothetical protein RLZZ226_1747 [Pseudomonadota bacterium]|jgi:hypothetical protein